jgi:UDP-N-acetyl-D-mannosaminuronic acid dehydrogenase
MNSTNERIAVVGMGYVGIPAAAILADAGYHVVGIQRRSQRSGWKIEFINQGYCPIGGNEPELPEMIKRVVLGRRLRVTDDYSEIKNADIILIDVQTATDANHVPHYESLKEACSCIAEYLAPGKTVIIESTVGPGTTENVVKPILEKESGLKAGLPDGFGLSFSYERVMVGRLIHNIREYPKIVGGIDAESIRVAAEMYRSVVRGGVFGTDIVTAEVSKTVENAYRDVQIAFANEIALLCESFGIDVYEVRKFVNGLPNDSTDPHANPIRNMHFPGAGVGGHCLPKDSWLLIDSHMKYAPVQKEPPASLLADARRLNDWMPVHMADLLASALKQANTELNGARIGVLGFAFLENSDDMRNTPTVTFLHELENRGATYTIHDPFIVEDSGYRIEKNLNTVLKGADAAVIMTGHEQYRSLDPGKFKYLLKNRIVIDGRNVLAPAAFIKEGFIFKGVGKGNVGLPEKELKHA